MRPTLTSTYVVVGSVVVGVVFITALVAILATRSKKARVAVLLSGFVTIVLAVALGAVIYNARWTDYQKQNPHITSCTIDQALARAQGLSPSPCKP